MEAAQIKPEYTNEDSYVVPFVTARLLGEFPDSTGKSPIMDGIFLGALAIHNELGSNKSALLPLYQDQDSSNTLKAVYHANIPTFLPEWFRIFSANFSRPESPKKVREYTEEIATSFGDRLAINRSLQVNILVPRDATNFISLPLSDKLKQMRYEILIGNPQDDVAETRQVVDAKGFYQNGHVIEAMLKNSLMTVWNSDDLDIPTGYHRDMRWLSAQYLSKNTRGNLFPQLVPTIQDLVMRHESALMAETNNTWGALAGLTAVIRR